jgi:hypothetical protein
LACPPGTLSIRLLRARELLRTRLVRRGLTFPAAGFAGLLAREASAAGAPNHLVGTAVQAGLSFANGHAVAAAVISDQAARLMKGALRAMFLTRMKITAAVVLAVLGVGLGLLAYQTAGAVTGDDRAATRKAAARGDEDVKEARPKDLIPTLIEALQDEDEDIRPIASATLVRLGRDAVPALTEVLRGKDRQLRAAVIDILKEMGPAARDAIPALIKTYRNKKEHRELRRAAMEAISSIVTGAYDRTPGKMQPMGPGMPGIRLPGQKPGGMRPGAPKLPPKAGANPPAKGS